MIPLDNYQLLQIGMFALGIISTIFFLLIFLARLKLIALTQDIPTPISKLFYSTDEWSTKKSSEGLETVSLAWKSEVAFSRKIASITPGLCILFFAIFVRLIMVIIFVVLFVLAVMAIYLVFGQVPPWMWH